MSEIELIKPEQVTVDITVQRILDQRRSGGIAGKLRRDAIGVPIVSHRAGGGYFVVDGQHRLEALRVAGFGDQPIRMNVFKGLTIEEEAELFRLFNATKALSAIDRFRIGLVERDPKLLAINDIVERNGYTTKPGSQNSAIAVVSMRVIYDRDQGDTLNRTLAVCSHAWGQRKHATHQTNLSALARMLFRYGNTVKLERLADKMQQDKDGNNPTAFLGHIAALADATGTTPANAGAGKLVTIYNRNFDKDSLNRLPDWH